MPRLNNRALQIPFGFKYFQPESRFNAKQGSFNNIVDQVVAMRKANPALAAKHNWPIEWNAVAEDVDQFNATICERMGWLNFITIPATPAPSPKFKALSPQSEKQLSAAASSAKKVWQGVRTLNDWFESGEPAVAPGQSEQRAQTCVACPLNGKGGLEQWFVKPAAAAIQVQFARLSERKLSTTLDDRLGTCVACLCPLRLKVHTPLDFITPHMGDETRRALDSKCWILAEESAPQMSTKVDTKS